MVSSWTRREHARQKCTRNKSLGRPSRFPSVCPLALRLADAARTLNSLHIGFLGGSITAGHGVRGNETYIQCAALECSRQEPAPAKGQICTQNTRSCDRVLQSVLFNSVAPHWSSCHHTTCMQVSIVPKSESSILFNF